MKLQQAATILMTVVTLAMAARAAAAAQERSFMGYAYDLESDELVYTETHREFFGEVEVVELETVYRGPAGDLIALRKVDFGTNQLAPEFRFEDKRLGYTEGMSHSDGMVRVFRQGEKSSKLKERLLEPPKLFVADAGFDRFVTQHWDRLVAGDDVSADFLIPGRARFLRFGFELEGEDLIDGEPAVTFRMVCRNAIVRLLVDPIRISYHRDHRILMRYEGMSNIKDANGDNYSVRIEFPFDERGAWAPAEGGRTMEATDG